MIGYRKYKDYFELIDSGDTILKYAMVWWYLPGMEGDYEFSWKFMKRRVSLMGIHEELKQRLLFYNDAVFRDDPKMLVKCHRNVNLRELLKKYDEPFIADVDYLGDTLYKIFIAIMSNKQDTWPENETEENDLLYAMNRLMRCFADSFLFINDIPKDGSLDPRNNVCMIIQVYAVDRWKWDESILHEHD